MFEALEIPVEHKDLIHDCSYDHYGRRMATCSSDHNVKVWDKNNEGKWTLTSSWKAHSGSVWRVTWSHPEFGQVLATCSFDRTAAVWEEIGPGERGTRHWVRRTNLVDSRTSVNDVKFGPKSHGLQLATCSAEGIIRIYEAPDIMNLSQWTLQHEVQCKLPCNCLCWNPSLSKMHIQMLAVGSNDSSPANGGKVFIFEYSENSRRWTKVETVSSITEPVHDLAFAPNLGRPYHILAVASRDVRIINLVPVEDEQTLQTGVTKYDVETVAQFDDHNSNVWRVTWDVPGVVLASTGDDGCVRMYRMTYINTWKPVGVMKGESSQAKEDQRTTTGTVNGSHLSPHLHTATYIKMGTISQARDVPWH